MDDEMFDCRLFKKLIPMGLCVEVSTTFELAPEAQQFTREQIQAACEDCPYAAD